MWSDIKRLFNLWCRGPFIHWKIENNQFYEQKRTNQQKKIQSTLAQFVFFLLCLLCFLFCFFLGKMQIWDSGVSRGKKQTKNRQTHTKKKRIQSTLAHLFFLFCLIICWCPVEWSIWRHSIKCPWCTSICFLYWSRRRWLRAC